MKSYFGILIITLIAISATLALFCSPSIIFAQSGQSQTDVSVTVTSEASCNNNGTCEENLGEDELSCFNDCGCNNNNACESQRGEDVGNCPNDCIVVQPAGGSAGGGGSIFYNLKPEFYVKNLKISNITPNSAEIAWQTNTPALCVTNLGKTSEYGKEIVSETQASANHSLELTDLSHSTVYHFNIACKNADDLTIQTGDKSFTTPYIIGDVNNFVASSGKDEISLSWENPAGLEFGSVRLVRNEYFYPADIDDGSVIYEGTGSVFVDRNVQVEKIYYYAIFSIGKNNSRSKGALAFAQIRPVKPPVAPPVTPSISANKEITITAASFFAEKINLSIGNNKTIEVSPNSPLTISANCAKIPGARKVVINLQNRGQDPSVILKIESAKDSCAISLTSPRDSGIYPIEILITDLNGRIIGRVETTLKVLGDYKLFLPMGAVALIIYLLLALAIILFVILIFRKKQCGLQTPGVCKKSEKELR